MAESYMLPDEDERLQALRSLALLDTQPEERFDRVTRLTAQLLEVPVAIISLVDRDREWFKSVHGTALRSTARRHSPASLALRESVPLILPNLQADETWKQYGLLEVHRDLRFYLARPLHGPGGYLIGTLTALDSRARRPTPAQMQALEDLARIAEHEINAGNILAAREELNDVRAAVADEGRFLQNVIDQLPVQIAVLDAAGQIERSNESWRRFAAENGMANPDLAIGRSYADVIQNVKGELGKQAWRVGNVLKEVQAGRRDHAAMDLACHTLDGPRWFRAEIFREGGRGDTRIVVVHEDTTDQHLVDDAERTALEQQLELQQLKAMDRFKGHLIQAVSREFNQPLTPIRLQLHLLREQPNDPERRDKALEILDRSVDRWAGLVEQLLDILRLQDVRRPMQRVPLDLRGLVADVVTEQRTQAIQSGVRLDLSMTDEPLPVEVDEERLHQVVATLVENALGFAASGGHIQVSARQGEAGVVVQVTDDGEGFAPEQLTRLFAPFRRHDPMGEHADTGVALFICKGIVEQHGGSIWVESDGPGRGSTFTFTIPLQHDWQAPEAASPASTLQRMSGISARASV